MNLNRYRLLLTLGGLLLTLVFWTPVRAQDGTPTPTPPPDTLVLLAFDPEIPTLFQALTPGAEAAPERFTARLELTARQVEQTPLVYVAVENTGWSLGALGFASPRLDPDAEYVALEVRDLGMAGYALREDGRAAAFPLSYVEALDRRGTLSGFRLDAILGATLTLRVFRVVEEGGLTLFARAGTLTAAGLEQERVTIMVDPQPVFDDLVLEFHIEALPVLPTPEPPAESTPEGA